MRNRPPVVRAALVALAFTLPVAAHAAPKRKRQHRPVAPPPLVWHVETLDGRIVASNRGDEAINPASVTKAATTMWAIERLGPDHRFETSFYARGTIDAKSGRLIGDLVVLGGGDPDFQRENAFRVARALDAAGVRRVTGKLVVDHHFWTGWEGGSEGTIADPDRRAWSMASRMRANLDPRRWTKSTRSAWYRFAADNGLDRGRAPTVEILGGLAVEEHPDGLSEEPLLVHRSKTLQETLRRFNCYSNNDIERVGGELGTADELSEALAEKLEDGGDGIRFETTSGLGQNRLTPRQIVGLMRTLRETALEAGTNVEELLPMAGCDPGTVTRFFPALARGENATALVGKTGTLTSTDGGVSVLAGLLNTADGELVFAVAAPRAAGRLASARRAEERFLLDLLAEHGGARPRSCPGPLAGPDDGADVVAPTRPVADAHLTTSAPM